jgi:hypothetical protein
MHAILYWPDPMLCFMCWFQFRCVVPLKSYHTATICCLLQISATSVRARGATPALTRVIIDMIFDMNIWTWSYIVVTQFKHSCVSASNLAVKFRIKLDCQHDRPLGVDSQHSPAQFC